MTYALKMSRRAAKDLDDVPEPFQNKIREAIDDLADKPRPSGCTKMKGHDDTYRIRVGDYRVVYSIDDKILLIEVSKVGSRKDVYR